MYLFTDFCTCDPGIRNYCFQTLFCLHAVPKQLEAKGI